MSTNSSIDTTASSPSSSSCSTAASTTTSSVDDEKKQKQIKFLAPYIDRINAMLAGGIAAMRYWRFVDVANLYESKLSAARDLLLAAPEKITSASKEDKEKLQREMKSAFDSLDEMSFNMFYLYANAIATPEQRLIDNEFRDVDWSQMKYVERVQKAVDARHRHAPGFDGVGGGVARSSSSAD